MRLKQLYINSLKHKLVYLILSTFFGIFLFYVSTLPHSKIENSPYPQISDLFDMIAHFIGFTIFNFILLSSLAGFNNRSIPKKMFILYLGIAVIWGVACEVSQYFIPSRSFQFIDIIANTAPAVVVPRIINRLL